MPRWRIDIATFHEIRRVPKAAAYPAHGESDDLPIVLSNLRPVEIILQAKQLEIWAPQGGYRPKAVTFSQVVDTERMSSSARASSSARTGRKTSPVDANAITEPAMMQQATEVRPILAHQPQQGGCVSRHTGRDVAFGRC